MNTITIIACPNKLNYLKQLNTLWINSKVVFAYFIILNPSFIKYNVYKFY